VNAAPVAQGIEHRPPEAGAQVRILPGAPREKACDSSEFSAYSVVCSYPSWPQSGLKSLENWPQAALAAEPPRRCWPLTVPSHNVPPTATPTLSLSTRRTAHHLLQTPSQLRDPIRRFSPVPWKQR